MDNKKYIFDVAKEVITLLEEKTKDKENKNSDQAMVINLLLVYLGLEK